MKYSVRGIGRLVAIPYYENYIPFIMKHNFNSRKITTSRWIRNRELLSFMMLPVFLMGFRRLWKECFLPMHTSLLYLLHRNGRLWTAQYLAAVSRAIVLWVGGERLSQVGSTVRVALTRSGLPLFLPGPLRSIFSMLNGDNHALALRVIKVTLTVLSVYRVIGCAPILRLETVTGPFTGLSATLPIGEVRQVIDWLPGLLKIRPISWVHLSESAGPNSKHATWSCGLDAIAFLRDPLTWYHWLAVAWAQGAWKLILWNVVLVVLSLPLVPVMLCLGMFPKYLGRLVTLFEARGKVRIIAITDWWSQVLLKPLHDGCFEILKLIPQDGTFDQMQPVERLLAYVRASGAKVYSFDLSAATDRLPILFQVQVLEALGVSWASHWAGLLVSRPWYLKDQAIFYAVGQPMGALSSWAMLAICHHIVVQIAARRCGYTEWFTHYALLGDDIIIADESVAGAYRQLMSDLGVVINLSKSFEMISGTLEFAKRWVHPHLGDLSPMGPGLILACIRNPRLLVVLIQDALNRDFVFSTQVVQDLVRFLRTIRPSRWVSRHWGPILSSIIGPDGGLWERVPSGPWFTANWVSLFPHHLHNKLGNLIGTLYQEIADQSEPPVSREEQIESLTSRFWGAVNLRANFLRGLVSAAIVLSSPAFWVYYYIADRAEERVLQFTKAQSVLYQWVWSSWAADGLDLKIRTRALKDFLRVNFDPDLLMWDRAAVEALLRRHLSLPALWESYFQEQVELREAQLRSMPVVVPSYDEDPYAYLDEEDDLDSPTDSPRGPVPCLSLVQLGYWAPVITQEISGIRHDSMVVPEGRSSGPPRVVAPPGG